MPSGSDLHTRRVALVTGAAKRLGRAISLGLADRGWDIAVHYRHSKADAEETVRAIRTLGRKALVFEADLADEEQTVALVARCRELFGTPTCLVNNASQFDFDDAESFSYRSLESQMRVNLAAPVLLAREIHRLMRESARAGEKSENATPLARGVVVNLLDQKLFNYNPDFLSYTLSKAALHAATTMLAQALAPEVRVVGVAPGITLPSGEQSASGFEQAHRATPLGRSSDPEDVANAVCFAVESPAITGTTIVVDGGQHLAPAARDVMFLARQLQE